MTHLQRYLSVAGCLNKVKSPGQRHTEDIFMLNLLILISLIPHDKGQERFSHVQEGRESFSPMLGVENKGDKRLCFAVVA